MDLLSTVRKQGSRGGVNFSWDEVATSAHRENYLGHSLKAPVGRWAQGRDLTWYAKADSKGTDLNETEDERKARERREEIQRIKEAEEDAIAKALGLPPKDRTGANAIEVPERRVAESKDDEMTKAARFLRREQKEKDQREAPLDRQQRSSEAHRRRRHRSRSRDGDRDRERKYRRERSSERHERRDRSRERKHRDDSDRLPARRRSRSRDNRDNDRYRHERTTKQEGSRSRSRSRHQDRRREGHRPRTEARGHNRSRSQRRRRSRSPA